MKRRVKAAPEPQVGLSFIQQLVAISLGAAGVTGDHADRVWEAIRYVPTPSTVGELAEITSLAITALTPTDKETK